jgi:pyruvate kinase
MLDKLSKKEKEAAKVIDKVCPKYQKSARNLVHYNAFRSYDLKSLQKALRNLSLSRLANAEGHIKASLLNTRFILSRLVAEVPSASVPSKLSIKESKRLLTTHTKELLGYRSKGRRVRIMVTQPTEAAYNYQLVYQMVQNGMNCARVNCAHDGPEVWEKIIFNVKKAAKAFGKKVKITMDLAGPKIRTGPIMPGPAVLKFKPQKDLMGKVTKAVTFYLSSQPIEGEQTLILPKKWLKELKPGRKINFKDARDKKRVLIVEKCDGDKVVVAAYKTCYITTGTVFQINKKSLPTATVGPLPKVEQSILLKTNDLLVVHKGNKLGQSAQYDEAGQLTAPAHISCQIPEVFQNVKQGEAILFDDGKIEGIIESVHSKRFTVRITRAKLNGARLKAEKGINFPTSDLGISGLTAKDKLDLNFVVQHADVVNFSFVNSKEDVEDLLKELKRLKATNKLSIILKIETQRAFDNLKEILLTAMQVHYIGVMIARGDLAVEVGWDHIGRVQKEILSICGAAHIPVVWATQVLENLAKTGLPSRAEMTDAATSLNAECVMLNKGPYINDTIQLLNKVLGGMESYQEKNEAMLPKLQKLLQ